MDLYIWQLKIVPPECGRTIPLHGRCGWSSSIIKAVDSNIDQRRRGWRPNCWPSWTHLILTMTLERQRSSARDSFCLSAPKNFSRGPVYCFPTSQCVTTTPIPHLLLFADHSLLLTHIATGPCFFCLHPISTHLPIYVTILVAHLVYMRTRFLLSNWS